MFVVLLAVVSPTADKSSESYSSQQRSSVARVGIRSHLPSRQLFLLRRDLRRHNPTFAMQPTSCSATHLPSPLARGVPEPRSSPPVWWLKLESTAQPTQHNQHETTSITTQSKARQGKATHKVETQRRASHHPTYQTPHAPKTFERKSALSNQGSSKNNRNATKKRKCLVGNMINRLRLPLL
jgi:hypothetical protein